ncbi:MAG: CarD-like transcriptional regulator, partial [uncultured Frankineae bacterium]
DVRSRRDRRLPAPRGRAHRGHRDPHHQGRGQDLPRPQGR